MNTNTPASAPQGPPRPLRSDAKRNREKILHTAARVFAEHGADVSMETIAETAGVGVGSIYRCCGSKAELMREIYRSHVAEIVERTAQAAALSDPAAALSTFLDVTSEFYANNRLYTTIKGNVELDAAWGRSIHTDRMRNINNILDRAKAANLISEDLTATDLEFTLRAICQYAQDSKTTSQRFYRRMVTLLLLNHNRPNATPLPAPITEAEYADFIFSAYRDSDR